MPLSRPKSAPAAIELRGALDEYVEVVEQVVLQEQAGRRLGPGLELGVGWGWGQGLGPRLQVTCAS